jgi:LmeA-like phospholipid-binding
VTDPWARPANQVPPVPPPSQFPQGPPPPQFQQGPPPGQAGFPPHGAQAEPPNKDSSLLVKIKNLFRDPLSIVLTVVIVIALVAAGLLAGELYARSRADQIVAKATGCVVEDKATASFGALPPFLMQHISGHYTNIHVETAGNQIRQAKGMKVNVVIKDVRLEDTANSSGSIGSLVANITWSSQGIKDTIASSIPIIGSFVTGVTTNPSASTIELQGALGSITAKPTVVDNGISLQVLELSGLGFTLPRETVQPALDAFTSTLTKNYPLGIHADAVQVTDSGVVAQFSTQNASIPKGQEDPCFAGL